MFKPVVPLLFLSACLGQAQTILPPPLAAPSPSPIRILFVGDTGVLDGDLPGDAKACDPDPHNKHAISTNCRARMIQSMRHEQADGLVALGDLVYPWGPSCPSGQLHDAAAATFDRVLGTGIGAVNIPVWLALGNHDLAQRHGKPASLACYVAYAKSHETIVFPERNYLVQLGPVLLVVLDTQRPPKGALVKQLEEAIAAHRRGYPQGWVVGAGHHPVKTYRDDTPRQSVMRPWVLAHMPAVDLWMSGHAHFEQLVVHHGIPNATAGVGGKTIRIADCPAQSCGPDERWSWSEGWGYGVVQFTPTSLTVTFKNVGGEALYTWSRTHNDPQGQPKHHTMPTQTPF